MPDVNVSELSVEVKANVRTAESSLNNLIKQVQTLNTALSGVNVGQLNAMSNSINRMNSSIMGVNTTNLRELAKTLNSINRLGQTNLKIDVQGTEGITKIAQSLTQFNEVSINPEKLSQIQTLSSAISSLGYEKVNKAIANIPLLATELNNLMAVLSKSPQVSANTISLINSITNLANSSKGLTTASTKMASGLKMPTTGMTSLRSNAFSLARVFGTLYANFFLVIRGLQKLKSAINNSMSYIETLNYLQNAWQQVADNADLSAWEQLGYESAEAYYNSFSEKAEEVISELTGISDLYTTASTVASNNSLGLDPSLVASYSAQFGQLASSMNVASDYASKISEVMLKLGADIASVKNVDFSTVYDNLSSGLVGMSRALDKYGVNIRATALEELAAELGLSASVDTMGQSEKALLRMIVLLNSTEYAWADLAETLNQPANQLRLIQSNIQMLARGIGNLFLPTLQKVLPYLNAFIIALQKVVVNIGSILGIEVDFSSIFSSSSGASDALSTLLDDAENTSDAIDEVTASLMGFDEINKLSSSSDSDSSGVSAADLEALYAAFDEAYNNYLAEWQNAYDEIDNQAQELANSIYEKISFIEQPIASIAQAVSHLVSSAGELASASSPFIKGFFEGFTETNAEIINGIADGISELAEAVGLVPEDVLESLGELLGSIVASLLFFKTVTTVVTGIKGITTALTGMGTAASGASASLSALLASDVSTLTVGQTVTFSVIAAIVGWKIGNSIYEELTGYEVDMGIIAQVKYLFETVTDTEDRDNNGTADGLQDIVSALDTMDDDLAYSREYLYSLMAVIPGANVVAGWLEYQRSGDIAQAIIAALPGGAITYSILKDLISGINGIGDDVSDIKNEVAPDTTPTSSAMIQTGGQILVSSGTLFGSLSGGIASAQSGLSGVAATAQYATDRINAYSNSLASANSSSSSWSNSLGVLSSGLSTTSATTNTATSKLDDFINHLILIPTSKTTTFTVTDNASSKLTAYASRLSTIPTNKTTTLTATDSASSKIGYVVDTINKIPTSRATIFTAVNNVATGVGAVTSSLSKVPTTKTTTIGLAASFNKSTLQTYANNISTWWSSVKPTLALGIGSVKATISYSLTDGLASVFQKLYGIAGTPIVKGIAFSNGGFVDGYEDGLFTMNRGELVGKFDNGKTTVANNQMITEGIYQAVLSAMRDSGALNQNVGNVTVEIDGKKVFQAVQKQANSYTRTTGQSAFS